MTQLLPSDDDFNAIANPFNDGTVLWGYWISGLPWQGPWNAGDHEIYPSPSVLADTLQTSLVGPAISVSSTNFPTDGTAVGTFLWRQFLRQDAVAQLDWTRKIVTGSGHTAATAFRVGGVLARMQSPTLLNQGNVAPSHFNVGTSERLADFDGYLFLYSRGATSGQEYLLLRVNGSVGSVTVLARRGPFGEDNRIIGLDGIPPKMTFELRVENEGAGPDVRLIARRHQAGMVLLDGPPDDGWDEVFNYLDTSPSKITTAGRWGFALSSGHVDSVHGSGVACAANYWSLATTGGVVEVREEFARSMKRSARRVTNPWGGLKRVLNGAFGGDFYGEDAPTLHYAQMRRSVLLPNGITIGGEQLSGEPAGYGFCVAKRPPTHPSKQHRSLDIKWTAGSIDAPGAGIGLRMIWSGADFTYPGPDNGLLFGYVAVVEKKTSPEAWEAQLWHYNGSTRILLASADVTGPGAGRIQDQVQYVFTFETVNTGGSSELEGVVNLNATIDGVQIPWVLEPLAGVTLASGWVRDNRTSRIEQGQQEAIVAASDETFTDVIELEDWVELPFSAGPVADPRDQPNEVVPGELDGKTGVLDVPIEWPVDLVERVFVSRSAFPTGQAHVLLTASRSRRRWIIRANASVDDAARAALWTFFESHGVSVPFDWTTPATPEYPAGELVAASFANENLGQVLRDRDRHGFEIELWERLG